MFKLTLQSVLQTIVWTVIAGLAYPLGMTAVCQVLFKHQAEGSLVTRNGNIIGSALLAQQFTGTNYFWPRPSANSYGTGPSGIAASSGSNLGPTSGTLHTNVMNNIAAFIDGNHLAHEHRGAPAWTWRLPPRAGSIRTSAPTPPACKCRASRLRAASARPSSGNWSINLWNRRSGEFSESRASMSCC